MASNPSGMSSLVDTLFGGGSVAAANAYGDASSAGYDKALGYMRPYQEGGLQDYNKYRQVNQDFGSLLGKYSNPYDWNWQQGSKNPKQFYDELMGGYTETPQAKYLQDQAQKSVMQGASASGTLGSGAMYKALQNNAYNLSAQDMDRYFQNILGVNQRQMEYGNNLQNQQSQYRGDLKGLLDVGYNAANTMGDYEVAKAEAEARARAAEEEGSASGWGNLISMGAGALGTMYGGPVGGMAASSAAKSFF